MRGRVIIALLLPLGSDVDRAVVHHAADQALGRVIVVSLSWSAVSIVLALKLCRRPSEWPTSCITMCLIA